MRKRTKNYSRPGFEMRSCRNTDDTVRIYAGLGATIVFTILALGMSAPMQAQARISSADTELLLAGSEQTVFTASKKQQRVSDVPAAVTVITEEDIAASGAVTLLDVLRSAPGVDVIETSRSVADVSIRGFNKLFSNKLLVMVDGRSIYQTVYGSVFWHTEPLLLSRIKRIEIVRGPGSALYGANAFNGVINIITKTPAEMAAEPARTAVRSLVGEQKSTFNEVLTSGGNPSDWTYSVGAGYNRTDGFGDRKPGQARDSFTVPILTADLQKRVKRGSWLLSAGNSEATSDYVPTLALDDGKFHTGYASLTYVEGGVKNPILARFYGNSLNLNDTGKRDVTVQTYDVEVQQSRSLCREHSLIYGATFRHVQASTFATGTHSHSEELGALYAQDDVRIAARTHLFAGIRLDEDSIHGFNFTPRLSLVHHLPRRQSLRVSYGTSFRNPSLVEPFLDYQTPIAPGVVSVALGNKDLKPEKVTNYEIGYRKEIRAGHIAANLFYNKVTGLIESVPTAFAPSPPFPAGVPLSSTFRNANDASAVGLELEAEFHIARGVRGLANYSYQDVEETDGSRVDFSPQHKFNVGIQARLSARADGYLVVHFVGSSVYHSPARLEMIDANARVDARLGYRIGTANRPWTLAAVVTDLFDNRHLEVPTVTAPGAPVQSARLRRTLYMMITGKL